GRGFDLSEEEKVGIDWGFTPQGYVLPCFTSGDVDAARARMAMQNGLGLAVRWLEPDELDRLNPTLAPGLTRGGTYCAEDGYLTPPRNVTAYAVALATSGVEVREHTAFTGLGAGGGGGGRAGGGGGGGGNQPGRGSGDEPGPDLRPARGPHRRPRAGRGRRPGPDQGSGRRGAAPGGGHRAASGPGPVPAADGLRPVRRAVLASRGEGPAVPP